VHMQLMVVNEVV